MERVEATIKETKEEYWINKSCTPSEVYCSIKYYDSDFKSCGIYEEWAINVPSIILRYMESRFVHCLHYETEIYHLFVYVDAIKKAKKHPAYDIFCVRESDCIQISKSKDSPDYDISRLREYNMRYKNVSKIKNLTCSYAGVNEAERLLVKHAKKEKIEAKKEQKQYKQGSLF